MSKQLRVFEIHGRKGLIRTIQAYGELDALLSFVVERHKAGGNAPEVDTLYAVPVTRSRGDVLAEMVEVRR